MTERLMDEIELERYELAEGAAYHFEMHRRDFFKTLGGGILIAFTIKDALACKSPAEGDANNPARSQRRSERGFTSEKTAL